MARSCPYTRHGGPPIPLVLVPLLIQLVRTSCDPEMQTYLRTLLASPRGGPAALAKNAHRIVQRALSRIPSDVLYWFGAKVLNLPPEVALRTVEFLKSRGRLESGAGQPGEEVEEEELPTRMLEGGQAAALPGVQVVPLEIERRLERLEMDYRLLQEKHNESVRLLTFNDENDNNKLEGVHLNLPRELPLPQEPAMVEKAEVMVADQSMQLAVAKDFVNTGASSSTSNAPDTQVLLLHDVGLRLGRIFLEWAGDTMKQSLVTAAARSTANQAIVGAGVDLAGRLVDAIVA